REQRTDRPVDQAGDQRLLLRRTAFTLEVAARDASGRVELLLVVHGQWEEVDPGLGGFFGDDRREDGGLSVGGENGAVRLAGHAAGLEGQRAAGPFYSFGFDLKHRVYPLARGASGSSRQRSWGGTLVAPPSRTIRR